MQLAASSLQFPQETSLEGNTVFRSLPCQLQPASGKVGLDSAVTVLPNLRTGKGKFTQLCSFKVTHQLTIESYCN